MRPTGVWMPLYVGDYLADTTHLTTLEHGAYLLLMMAYWRRGEALPDDDRFLAKITGLHHHQWGKVKKSLRVMFDTTGEVWLHKRLEKEILKSSERSAAGVRANSVRWATGVQVTVIDTKKDIYSSVEVPQSPPTESPLLNGHQSGLSMKKKDDWPNDAFDILWKKYPEKVGKQAAIKAFAAARRKNIPWLKIITALDRYIATKPQDRSWCHASTWLNGCRWDDEYNLNPTPKISTNAQRHLGIL